MTKTSNRAEPRKQPRQARSSATVDAVVEATARIVESLGLDMLTTNRVAEMAGVSIGSLYQYFPSKEALLVALIRREREALLQEISKTANSTTDLSSSIGGFIRAGLAHQFKRPSLSRTLEYVETTLPMCLEDEELARDISCQLASILERHGVTDPKIAATDMIALCRGIIDAAALRGETDVNSLFSRLWRAVTGYLDTTVP